MAFIKIKTFCVPTYKNVAKIKKRKFMHVQNYTEKS